MLFVRYNKSIYFAKTHHDLLGFASGRSYRLGTCFLNHFYLLVCVCLALLFNQFHRIYLNKIMADEKKHVCLRSAAIITVSRLDWYRRIYSVTRVLIFTFTIFVW